MKSAKSFRLTPSGLVSTDNPVHQVLAPASMQPEKEDGATKLLMKLALTSAFNEAGEIQKEGGGYIKGTNILELVGFALSKDACIDGLPEFINILRSAGISEDLVKNDLVKQFLVMKKPLVYEPPSKPDEPTPVAPKVVEPYVAAKIKTARKKLVKRLRPKRAPVLEAVRPLSASKKRQQDPLVSEAVRPLSASKKRQQDPPEKRKILKRHTTSKYARWDPIDSDMDED